MIAGSTGNDRVALPPIGMAGLATWAIVAVLLVNGVFLTGTSNFLASPQARIVNQLILLGVGIVVAGRTIRGDTTVRTPLLLPAAGFIAAYAVAALLSDRPAASYEALATLLISIGAYPAVRAVTWSSWLGPRVDRLLVASAVLLVVAYLLQASLYWVQFWSVVGPAVPPLRPADAGLTIGTVNAVALHLELLVPLAAWLAWRRLARPRLAAALLLAGAVALVITGSRGAWLGAAAGLVVAVIAGWVAGGRTTVRELSRRSAGIAGVVIVTLGLVAVVLAPVLVPRLLAGDAGRVELWTAAGSMFASSPVTGTGPGTYPQLRPLTPISQANLAVLTTSHNSVLQVLVDGGILGLGAAGALVVVVSIQAVRGLRSGGGTAERGLVVCVGGSLASMMVHSTLDPQFHVPAVVLLIFLLVARLDPRDPQPSTLRPVAPHTTAGIVLGATVVLGAAQLVPIDVAMVRAQQGNLALAEGDNEQALEAFRTAAELHELAPYRLGEGLAAAAAGDGPAASRALLRAEDITGLSFISANLAVVDPSTRSGRLATIRTDGRYDATALVNAAALLQATDPVAAIEDLAAVMAQVPSLVYSTPPVGVFSKASWVAAQARAIELIATEDPAVAAAVARLADRQSQASAVRASVVDPAARRALELLDTVVDGHPLDLPAALDILQQAPTSGHVLQVLAHLGFAAEEQELIDALADVSVPVFFNVPTPPMELVVDGSPKADWSLRLPRYPMASDFRLGPARPYVSGMLTIEPVFRPD